jgi:hypothetical protein
MPQRRTLRLLLAAAVLAIGGSAGLLGVVPAMALACVVTSTADNPNAGLGTCASTAAGGAVTLRSAIQAANTAGGTNTITFNLPAPSTILLTGGELDITTGNLTITGPGARNLTIDGNATSRGFVISSGATASISGLTVTHAHDGSNGGAVQTFGTVALDQVNLTDNHIGNFGGGVEVEGSGASLTMTNSLVSGNSGMHGAGIALEGTTAPTTLTNVTIANNTNAGGSEASAIDAFGSGVIVNLVNVTVSGNTSTGAPQINYPQAAIGVYGSTVNFSNTIVANNTPKNCSKQADGAGTIGDNGYNLDSANDCGFTAGSPKFDLLNSNPLLGALANNGGPTDTMALGAGSPAIDTANPACPPPATDQRGITRPQGTRCDRGAFEVVVTPTPSPTPSVAPVLPAAGHGGGAAWSPVGAFIGLLALALLAAVMVVRRRLVKRPTTECQ